MFKKLINKILKTPEVISFRQSFDLTELAVITLHQNDKKVNLILDSGSNDNVVDSNIINQLEYTSLDETSELFGLEGSVQTVKKCNIDLSYEDRNYKCTFLICDMKSAFDKIKKEIGVTVHGTLGTKFFNEHKYVLDFDKLVAYSKK